MKNQLALITITALLLVSCSETPEPTDAREENTQQTDTTNIETGTPVDDSISHEGSPVEDDERYDDLSLETTSSDCFIVSHFVDMDIQYVTVDFTNYKVIETDSEPEYELVNEIKTLRTFVVKTEYFDCSHSEMVSIDKLIEQSEENKETEFYIETEGGLVVELFVRNCAG